ncbi:MAG TPA: hypothetical protein VN040_16020 [Pseudosphingobacterium sp.]|nr:hypothetical protein [Pseudosphingobacterium sp.]
MFIQEYIGVFPVERMCSIIKVSSSGFYKWLTKPKSNRERKTEELSKLIREEHENSDQIYGSPRITSVLNKKNHQFSRSYIANVFRFVLPEGCS